MVFSSHPHLLCDTWFHKPWFNIHTTEKLFPGRLVASTNNDIRDASHHIFFINNMLFTIPFSLTKFQCKTIACFVVDGVVVAVIVAILMFFDFVRIVIFILRSPGQ
jgi:hypothetical protein